MIIGDRFTFIDSALDWVEQLGVVVVSVDYRLAPEHPDLAPIQHAYAGMVWTAEHADNIGIDATRLLVAGMSAGVVADLRSRCRSPDTSSANAPTSKSHSGMQFLPSLEASCSTPGPPPRPTRTATTSPAIVDHGNQTERDQRSRWDTTRRYIAPTGNGSDIRPLDGVTVADVQWHPELVDRIRHRWPPSEGQHTHPDRTS